MTTPPAIRQTAAFGEWLKGRLIEMGMNQREFAAALGVGTSTVSRWVNGGPPDAMLLERIADVLLVDYDDVATEAGIRPRELRDEQRRAAVARLTPIIERVQWDEERLGFIENALKFYLDVDAKRAGRR